MKQLIGKKLEMTQVFEENGKVVPVTILDISNVVIAEKIYADKNGYNAVVIGKDKQKNPTKAMSGKYTGLGFVPAILKEEHIDETEFATLEIGTNINADFFTVGDKVGVSGISKGKGFQGVVKRHGFHGGPKTHGQSDRHRAAGSIGSGTTPGRVYKGKKMPGRMGNEKVTVKNLKVMFIDVEKGLVAIKGAIPGNKGSYVIINK